MTKKISWIVLAAIIVLGGFIALSQMRTTEPASDKQKVAATIFPAYDITRQIAGDTLDVELILPPGTSPHVFDPTPSALRKLEGAERIFMIAEGLDDWALGIAENIDGAEVVDLDEGITLRESEEPHEEHEDDHDDDHEDDDGHDHGGSDPHYWLDPNNAVVMAQTIAEELAEMNPSQKDVYQENLDAFAQKIADQDALWKKEIASLTEKDLVTFHDAFYYFADHFGLHVVATFEPYAGKEPTPTYLQHLIEEIEEFGVSAMFTEPQLYAGSVEQFAADHNVTLSVLDPLGGVSGRESYIDMVSYNVDTIVEALK